MAKIKNKGIAERLRHYFLRTLLGIGIFLAAIVFVLLSMIFVLTKGPSASTKELFVLSVKGSSAAGFLADIFLDDDEVNAILEKQNEAMKDFDDVKTDISLIKIKSAEETGEEKTDSSDTDENDRKNGIETFEVKMPSFNGTMMVVSDPTRIVMGTPDEYGENHPGMTLPDLISKYDAIAGINGGGFYDPSGLGNGGIPTGIVISDGKMLWGNAGTLYHNFMGIDYDGILHVGSITGSEAMEIGIKEACSFDAGPTLIINSTPCNEFSELGGGRADRTAIGQRSDGAILLLVTNGRQIGCLGATYDDIVNVMLEYGAVNAAALDGGSSTLMLYDGEAMNTSSLIFGGRTLATSFLVI